MYQIQLAKTLIGYTRARAADARARGRNEVGASALEWAIISAIIVGIAIFVAAQIRDRVTESTDELGEGTTGD